MRVGTAGFENDYSVENSPVHYGYSSFVLAKIFAIFVCVWALLINGTM